MNEDKPREAHPAEQSLFAHVYILVSQTHPKRTYVGMTEQQLSARLKQHNSGHTTATAAHRPWRIASCVSFASRQQAAAFESYLKSGSGFRTLKKYFLN